MPYGSLFLLECVKMDSDLDPPKCKAVANGKREARSGDNKGEQKDRRQSPWSSHLGPMLSCSAHKPYALGHTKHGEILTCTADKLQTIR
jgi:hypothetical protein